MKNRNELCVIIDPQKDFTNHEGIYAGKHSGILQISDAKQKIKRLLSLHDYNIAIVFSDYEPGQFEKGLSICIPGTEGHKLDIEIDPSFTLISKNNHSCFSSGNFSNYLKYNGVASLVLCGFLAEYCVKQTAIDGLKNRYRVSLLKECIGTGDDVQERKQQVLKELEAMGAIILHNNY